jgi:hypothetical protein
MLVSGSLNPQYLNTAPDLGIYLLSGAGAIGDGTLGGGPLSGINFGITNSLVNWTTYPSGVIGTSLKQIMKHYPTYSRISWDPSSLGAQIYASVSYAADQLLEENNLFKIQKFVPTYPLNEQGVIYEWDFSDATVILDQYPKVTAYLGSSSFDIPITRSEDIFWQSPPSRVEATNCEISGFNLTGFINIGVSGLFTIPYSGILPFYNFVVIDISGATYFDTKWDPEDPDKTTMGYVELQGYLADDNLNTTEYKLERFVIPGNGTYATGFPWREIIKAYTFNIDPAASVRLRVFNFNNKLRLDNRHIDYWDTRSSPQHGVIWQRLSSNTSFSGIVKNNIPLTFSPSDDFWIANCWLISEANVPDFQFDIHEFMKIVRPDGITLSGVVDFTQIPNTRFMLALDNQSKIWVFDNYTPGLAFAGLTETVDPPARIELTYPEGSHETPSRFTVDLNAYEIVSINAIQRYSWSVYHHNSWKLLAEDGTEVTYEPDVYTSVPQIDFKVPKVQYVISGTGQYTFELQMVTADSNKHRTYAAISVPEKRALGMMPINGLSINPSGIDVDAYGRIWVTDGNTAVRLVSRNDIGMWLIDESTFVTRANYDSVNISGYNTRQSVPRNVFTKLDELGMYFNMDREIGETLVNFKHRLHRAQSNIPGGNITGTTTGINQVMDLGQFYALNLNFSADFDIEIEDINIKISGNGYNQTISTVVLDPDGYWIPRTFQDMYNDLAIISGITPTLFNNISGLPALLLEQQSSHRLINSEPAPVAQVFQLGQVFDIDFTKYKLVSGMLEFANVQSFDKLVSGIPQNPGEYSADPYGLIRVFEMPRGLNSATYVYNVAVSGSSMRLVANGAKAINLSNPEVQDYLFYVSGIGLTGEIVTNEILKADRMFWGK